MSDILLVHGACHGAWCWREVIEPLHALGHTVRAIDLPGHGDNHAAIDDITLEAYADAVIAALDGPSILVGHSMGGFVIAAAAVKRPDLIDRLIFLCAYMPRDGMSLNKMRYLSEQQPLLEAITLAPDMKSWLPKPQAARATFYHDCSDAQIAFALENVVPQATAPSAVTFAFTSEYTALDKSYIVCKQDGTIPPDLQDQLASDLPADERYEMDSSHSPFFSQPGPLAGLLDQIARK